MPTKEIDIDNLEKIEHSDYIDVYLEEEFLSGDILEVAKRLLELPERVKKEAKATHGKKHDYIRFEIEIEHDYDYSSISLRGIYLETDKQLEDRKAYLRKEEERKKKTAEKKQANKAENERKQYLRLKEKFGDQ